jgi:6-phosphogluconolactonase
MSLIVYDNLNRSSLIDLVVRLIIQSSGSAIKDRGRFRIVLTGGETPNLIYSRLINIETDWSLWEFWISDERCVPKNDPLSNELMIRQRFLKHIPVDESQIHFMNGENGPVLGAEEYKKHIDRNIIFDLTILGIGEDGHIASLFPGNELGSNSDDPEVLPIFNSPKPPSERISLSLRSLNRSMVILILANGIKKKNIIDNFQNGLEMPALHVHGIEATYLLYCPNHQI